MRPVNLLPEDRKKRERQSLKLSPVHGAAAAVLLGAVALGYWGHGIRGDVAEQKQLVADLEARQQTLTAEIAQAKKNSTVVESTYEIDKALVSGLTQARVNWSTVMVNLARVAPSGVWLESLSVKTPAAGAGDASGAQRPAAITLQAGAKSRTEAALFLSRLDGVRGFVQPRLEGGIAEAEGDEGSATSYTFTVLIPVDDAIFAPGSRPAATVQPAPATTTPTPQP